MNTNQAYLRMASLITFCLITIFIILSPDNWSRLVLTILLAYFAIYFLSLSSLLKNKNYFNIFDLRIISISVIFCYAVIPLIGYAFSEFQLNEFSDNRLNQYNLGSNELSLFYLKFYLPFFLSFIFGIFLFGKKDLSINISLNVKHDINLFIVLILILLFLNVFLNYVSNTQNVSLLLKQFNNVFGHFRRVGYFLLIIFIFLNWENKLVRFLFFIYLFLIFYEVINNLSSRTFFFKNILATCILYCYLVRSISIKVFFSIGLTLLLLAIFIGAKNNNMYEIFFSLNKIGVASNEWWSLFGTAYDLYKLKFLGLYNYTTNTLTEVIPNYIRYNDFFYLIPQQFVTKVDPSLWYLNYIEALDGKSKFGIGFTWGAISTLVIWNNILFTLAYGLFTGAIIGLIHNWFLRNKESIYAILIYTCCCVYCYGIIRVGTGYFIYEIIYRVLPFVFVLIISSSILKALTYPKRSK